MQEVHVGLLVLWCSRCMWDGWCCGAIDVCWKVWCTLGACGTVGAMVQ